VGIVFVHHAGLDRFPGPFGVTIFFFLSGYLITTLLRIEYDRTATISLRDFYLRRVLRIFPPFYLVWALATVLTLADVLHHAHVQLPAVAAQALYVSNYYDTVDPHWATDRAPGTWVFWSLAVEEHFYLGFPLLYLLLRRRLSSRMRQAGVLLAICGLVLVWRGVLVFVLHRGDRVYVATDTRLDSILFGCVLAIAANPILDPLPFSIRARRLLWLPLGMVGLAVSLAVRMTWFQETLSYSVQGLCLAPVFLVAISNSDALLFRPLNWAWVKLLGVLSYSLYLLHNTVLVALAQWLAAPGVVRAVIAAMVCVAIAFVIHHAVEKPCARLRARLSHLEDRPPPPPYSSVDAAAARSLVEKPSQRELNAARAAGAAHEADPYE
jgi:peptidoglycan/LPS O-acetylase OafA/YrhL